MLSISLIDQHLSEAGKFCLIDWLLSANLLHYGAYEDWRYGRIDTLDSAIQLDRAGLTELLADVENHCTALNLEREPQDFYRWDESGGQLRASERREQHEALSYRWLRPDDLPQQDLFMDNAAIVAENRLRDALGGRHFDQAQAQLQQLVSLNSQHSRLGAYQDLINYGQHMRSNERIQSAEAVEAELLGLQQEALPLAEEALGQAARDYLASAWYRLAENLHGLAFNPEKPQLHRSYALLQIPDWPALMKCLEGDPDLYRVAALVERLAATRVALQQHEAALLTWCIMFDRFGEEAEAAIEAQGHSPVALMWDSFWEQCDTGPAHYFPAYLLARQPGLIHHLNLIPDPEQPATRAMIALLRARLAGEDEVRGREGLQKVSPALLQLYLEARIL